MWIILIIISWFCFLLWNIFNKNYINYIEQELDLEEIIKTNNKEKIEELTEEKEKIHNLAYICLWKEKICYNLWFILLIIWIILFFI